MTSVSETLQAALTFHQADDLPQAEKLYRQILRIDPEQADALHLLGVTSLQQGRNESALDLINQAIAVNGKAAPYHNNLGTVSQRLGRIDSATACFRTAIGLSANFTDAHYNLGTLLKEQGEFQQALDSFRETLRLDPGYAKAHNNLGIVLKELGRIDEAIACYRRVLELNPNSPEAYDNLGVALGEQEKWGEAVQCHQQAISLRPDFAEFYFNLGNTFRDQDRLNEALRSYQQALEIEPEHAEALSNLGLVQLDLGKPDEAISIFAHVIRNNPIHVAAHMNHGFALRLTGHLESGWNEYDWRWMIDKRREFSAPVWDGSPLREQTLLLSAEQGVGDEIFHASCFEDVFEKTESCVLECDPRLVSLYSRSFPNAEVVASTRNTDHDSNADLPSFDVELPIGSLHRLFRRSFGLFPDRKSYLIAEAELQKKWEMRFQELGENFKVGISWKGGLLPEKRRRRSTTLNQWKSLLTLPGVTFVNLQYGDCVDELEEVHRSCGVRVHDWDDANPLVDLDGFAAQISALDLVISIDNATVHMAGALGVAVWTLLPFSPDCRWFLNRSDSPWYPSMRMFRQRCIGDWDGVFDDATEALRKRIISSDEDDGQASHSSQCVASEETVDNPKIVNRPDSLSQAEHSCQTVEDLSQATKAEADQVDVEQQWLIENKGLRMDAQRPFFEETRREFNLNRYQFATQYCQEKRVLDAACGTGYGSALMAETANEVHGIDACPRTIDYAQRNYGNGHLNFHKSRVEWIPFDEEYFDLVVSFETIEHTISPRWVMQEFVRVLRADGTAIISIPNSWGLTPHHFVDFDLPQLQELTEQFFEEQEYFYNNSRSRANCTHFGIGPLDDIDPDQAECIVAVCRRPRKEHLGERRIELLLDELYEPTIRRHQESLFSSERSLPIQTIETQSLGNLPKVHCGDFLLLDARRAGDQQGRVFLELETEVKRWNANSVTINLPQIDLDDAVPARLHVVLSDGTYGGSSAVQLVSNSSSRKT